MKYALIPLALLAVLAPASLPAQQQQQQPAAAPHQVALIDMAHIFKNYEKFTALTDSLQKEIEQSDEQAKTHVQNIQRLQEQLASGNLAEGSADFSRIEGELLQAQTGLETFKRSTQRDFLRREAELYKTIYLEVEAAVKQYSRYFGYTLVLRFSRENVDSAQNPQDVINGLNRQVIFFQTRDDITEPILDHLNATWKKSQAAGVSPAAGQAPANQGTR